MDKTCCFYIAKYGQEPYAYNVSLCAPIDYNKTSKAYNETSPYVSNSKYFCNDLKYSAMKAKAPYSIVDCKCQMESTGPTILFGSGERIGIGILLMAFIVLILQ